jgi:hypothetical protein
MLTIKGIEDLKDQKLGYWTVVEAGASKPRNWCMTEHYCITLDRAGNGAAILIWRNINPLNKQYHVDICYDDFTNKIYEGAFYKKVIMDKGHFLKSMMGWIKAEHALRNKK